MGGREGAHTHIQSASQICKEGNRTAKQEEARREARARDAGVFGLGAQTALTV